MTQTGRKTEETAFIADVLRAEAEAIERIARQVAGDDSAHWKAALDLLESCTGHVVVAGMGKSGLIGAKISATLCSVGIPSNTLHPAEAVHGDLGRVRRGDVVLLLSYSGNTEEVCNLAAILQADALPRLGISCSHDSQLARLCDVHLSTGDITEACPLNLAPTASTTAMLALGDALALGVSRRRNFSEDDFHKHHPGGMLGVGLRKITEALRFRVDKNLPVVSDKVTVRQALEQAVGDRRTGAILLVDEAGRLSGIFTDADFRRLMRTDEKGMSRTIAEVMTKHPKHLTTDDLVRDAVALTRERRLDEIPVLDPDGKPVGLVDVQDLIAMKVVSE
ncbi:MAG: KpsF/GutQ family sugar-phosphate isomerase [Planctomycetes bacterium]|nr:KpsF/GutQ family sugar-phosphate isomerase [Planctomycetota bacterium]MCH7601642.1 KpsF/GutQ family sugar-phosphate isomerase [Planctomycetota bacterium]